MSKFQLIYFPMAGRAEALRFAMHFGGLEFEDVKISFQG